MRPSFAGTAGGRDRGPSGIRERGRCITPRGGTGAVATPKNYSVMKAFALLKAFREPHEWLTSCELSRRANLPEASGYRLIQTLEEIGAVVRGPRGR